MDRFNSHDELAFYEISEVVSGHGRGSLEWYPGFGRGERGLWYTELSPQDGLAFHEIPQIAIGREGLSSHSRNVYHKIPQIASCRIRQNLKWDPRFFHI